MSEIELSALAPPREIEDLSFVELRNAWAAGIEDADLASSLVAGDLVTESIYVGAYREMYVRARLNDQIRSAFLGLSYGDGLDILGAQMDVDRSGLSDSDYRAAIHAKPRPVGTGTRTRYEREAEKAHSDVLRARAVLFATSVARIYFSFPAGGNPTAASSAIVARVSNGVDDDGIEIRMITDLLDVLQGTPVSYNITANLHVEPGPDVAEVLTLAQARLQPVIDALLIPGQPMSRSEILSALHTTGVAKVDLTEPAADIASVAANFYRLGTLTLTTEVASWLR